MKLFSLSLFVAATVTFATLPSRSLAAESSAEATAISSLKWRSVGPANMGGRVTAVLGVPGDPKTFWIAGADGGLWKTTNGGTTYEAQFESYPVYSVGAIALAASDRNVLWLGTGEGDPRNSTSYGDGVYRSTDGGRTFVHLGLAATERIKRIVVHPTNPDVAYVCALGRAWGPNEERGVFRTVDGGKTWEKVLYKDEDTGCSDIAIDESNPRVLYAGMYTFRRRPWRFDSGGKETALYKSTDGGLTWTKKSKGLPKGPMDRIGVALSRTKPDVVYVVTEAVKEGTLFRSDDAGESFRMVNDDARINFRPFYYSDIRVDPNNPDVVYSLSGGLYKSTDGGKSFESIGRGIHGDHQALWIDPMDSDRVLSGSDGGFQVSLDGGANWEILNNIVLAQFYHVFLDDRDPYYICGGLQDNGNWCGPSRSGRDDGIVKDDWYTVSGGDGFFAVPIPGQPNLVYSDSQGGNIVLTDTRSGNARRVHPYPKMVGSHGDALVDHEYRFNWDAPIHISPYDPGTVYFGGNVVFKSTDYGQNWDVVSPDLTTNDKSKQLSSGGEVVVDNTAAEFHCAILTIAESPVAAGVIWAGTDDGNIQLTRDGGKTWTNVKDNVPGLPAFSWIANIEPSHIDGGTAYVAVDDHRSDDFKPYAFATRDYGKTWTPLQKGLPQDDYVKVVREDPKSPDVLYAGMERGIQASWDGGKSWSSIRNNLPPVSVRDIQVHPRDNDLVIGTHGRGAWILDDATPLQALADAMKQDAYLFDVRPAVRWTSWNRDAALGQKTFSADNPPDGAIIDFYLKVKPEKPVTLTITDGSGDKVEDIQVKEPKAGVNRVVWNLRHEGPAPIEGRTDEGGGFFARFGSLGPMAAPGEYRVTLDLEAHRLSASAMVKGDPRIEATVADYQAQLTAATALRDLQSQVNRVISATLSLEKQLDEAKDQLGGDGNPEQRERQIETVGTALEEVKALKDKLERPIPGLGYRQYPRIREELRSLYFAVNGAAGKPTEPQLERLDELRKETANVRTELEELVRTRIQEVNDMLGPMPRIRVKQNAPQ
jgi:photosystem II stability/assembly factor-like uncharacterized protein